LIRVTFADAGAMAGVAAGCGVFRAVPGDDGLGEGQRFLPTDGAAEENALGNGEIIVDGASDFAAGDHGSEE
jgi:hypothetical protein